MQVADASSFTPIGFSSGDPTPYGSFSYEFNQPGTYYYWSGYVEESQQITFRGVVSVLDSFDKQLEVDVQLNGFKAQKCQFPFNSSCAQIDFNYTRCSPTETYTGQAFKCINFTETSETCFGNSLNFTSNSLINSAPIYKMLFTTGNNTLPTIESITTDNIHFNSRIIIKGSNFSTIECENKVIIGEEECPIFSSSATQIECQLNANSTLEPNVQYSIEVLIKNIGYALQNNAFSIKFSPVILTITQNVGSLQGGSHITITGNGFVPLTILIQIGNNFYYNKDSRGTLVKFNLITLQTYPHPEGIHEIKVTSNNLKAFCLASNCYFNYSQVCTPILNSVSPNSVNSSNLITLTGSNLNTNLSDLEIKIGTQICVPVSVNENEITCQLNGLNLGDQQVNVNIFGLGDAQSDQGLFVKGLTSISDISPLTGSVYGGTVLTMNGNGFDETTRVLLDNVDCKITSFKIDSLACISGPHSADKVNINIR